MATYLYKCLAEENNHGEFEVDHSIKDKLDLCPHCQVLGKESKVERLIAGGSSFILQGSSWAANGYS